MYTDDGGGQTSLAYQELYRGEPHAGDFDMGSGFSTSQLQNPNTHVPASTTVAPGPIQSPAIWGMIIVLLIIIKLLAEKAGKASEFSTVRVGFENLFLVTLMAAIGFYALKVGVNVVSATPTALKQFVGAI